MRKNSAAKGKAEPVSRPMVRSKASKPDKQHLLDVLRAVRNVNQLITHEKDKDALLQRACEILTETRGYWSAWIAVSDVNGRTASANESNIGPSFAGLRADLLSGQWPVCAQKALATKSIAILRNPNAECGECPLAGRYGDVAVLSAALRHNERAYGVLTLALPGVQVDVEEEQALVTEVAGDLALALHTLELEAQHRAAELREAHIKQVLLAIRNVNQLIVHEENPQRLIERACENLTETLGYLNAWIALFDGDGHTVGATACAGLDGRFVALRERLTAGGFVGCMRQALAENATIVTSDPSSQCTDCPLAQEYSGRAGFTRQLSFDNKLYGILAVSVPAELACDAEEQSLFDEMAGDLGFALHKIELQAGLREAERHVRNKLNAVLAPEGDVGEVDLADIIDMPAIQGMMDDFYSLTGIGIGIIDLKGHVLVSTGWQDLCTKFHRVHPVTRRHCIESDTVLSSGVEPGSFKIYRCKNNLWDMVTPIMLGGRHVGNLFLGQFIFKDEEPDRELFRDQARQYGFVEEAYLAALDRLPRWSRERVTRAMTFYAAFARQISDLSFGHIRLARTLVQRDELLARLGANEERLRLALKATNDVVWDWDIANNLQQWNEAGTAVFGWTDIVQTPQTGNWWIDRVHPEDRQRVDETFFAAVHDPAVERWSDEYRFRKADGSYAHVVDRGYILRSADGRAVRMIGAMLDSTESKETEVALRRSESSLKKAQEIGALGSWEWDIAAGWLTWSDELYRIWGVAPDFELTFDGINSLIHPDDRGSNAIKLKEMLESAGEIEFEFRIVTPEGQTRYVHQTAEVCRDLSGKAVRAFGIMQDITRHRLADEALQREHQRLQFVVDGARLGTWIWNVQTNETVFNEAWAAMLGLTLNELAPYSYKTWEQLVHPEDIAAAAERLQQCAAGKTADYECEFRMRHQDGHWVWILDRGRVMTYDAAGAPLSMFGTHMDITERKRAEEALWQSREILRAVLDNIPVRVFWKGTDLNYLGCNLAFARDAGFEDPEHIVGRDDFAMGWREQAELYRDDDRRVLQDGKPRLLFEEPQTTPSGEMIYLLTSKVPLRNAQGTVVGVLGTYYDITDLKRAEQALRKSEEHFRAANDASLDALLLLRSERDESGEIRDFVFVDLNRRTEEMLRMTREQLQGKRLCEELPINREAGFFAKYKRVVDTGIPLEEEFFLPETHVPAAWYYHQVVRVGDGIFICHRDIGERKRAEEEREKLQAQLLQAQKMESVGRLAGGVAHDFNNMLGIILGYGDMLLDQLHNEDPLKADVKEIVDAARRSSDLTHQLLAFARKQTLQPEVLPLNDIVCKFEKMLRRIIGEAIELQMVLADDVGYVLVDRGQIEQVITNLAVNAQDAMPGGGKLIIETGVVDLDESHADLNPDAKPGRYAMLAVTDTGCGMGQEILSHIFEPFFTTKEMGRGTGLGLSTIYGIIKQSNGNIWVHSEPEKGTIFKIYLPETDLEPMQKSDRNTEPTAEGAGQRILVVEDEPGLRRLLESSFLRLDYNVTVAANGGEALLLVEEKGFYPDLIITDVVMPNMSGRELVERLRRHRPDIKVLYMSGYTDDVIAHHGLLDPQIPFIQKPFTIREIADKVRQVLLETRGEDR